MVASARDVITKLVAEDDLEAAIEALRGRYDPAAHPDLDRELLMQVSRLTRVKNKVRRGLVSDATEGEERTRVGYALLELMTSLPDGEPVPEPRPAGVSVFISYNHADRNSAERLAGALARRGLKIALDSDDMQPGETIRGFIERAIGGSDATVCLISRASLLSGWVAMETLLALRRAAFDASRRFIAVYLDEVFLAAEFRLEATREIDARLAELHALLTRYEAEHLDPADLRDEITRLYELRHGLGEILERLRGSLLLDIRDAAFDSSVERLANSLA